MEWLNNIYQNFEGLLSNLAQYIQSNPKVGHLLGIFLLSIWLIGLIFNWKWTYKGERFLWMEQVTRRIRSYYFPFLVRGIYNYLSIDYDLYLY